MITVKHPDWAQARTALADSVVLAIACLVAYLLATKALSRVHSVSPAAWALALLVGVSALTATVIGRPGDAITAAITTTVVLVVAAVSPHDAWEQPILRFADTAIGIAVGLGSAWLDQRVIRPRIRRTVA
jgi:uncharacterized membrane protein YccC